MLALSRADYISVEGFQGTDCDGPHNSEWAVGGAEAAAVQSAASALALRTKAAVAAAAAARCA